MRLLLLLLSLVLVAAAGPYTRSADPTIAVEVVAAVQSRLPDISNPIRYLLTDGAPPPFNLSVVGQAMLILAFERHATALRAQNPTLCDAYVHAAGEAAIKLKAPVVLADCRALCVSAMGAVTTTLTDDEAAALLLARRMWVLIPGQVLSALPHN